MQAEIQQQLLIAAARSEYRQCHDKRIETRAGQACRGADKRLLAHPFDHQPLWMLIGQLRHEIRGRVGGDDHDL
jgi:hypothetical protein